MQSLRDIATSPYLRPCDRSVRHARLKPGPAVLATLPTTSSISRLSLTRKCRSWHAATLRRSDSSMDTKSVSARSDRQRQTGASAIFDTLGIKPQIVDTDSSQALSMLQQGALDAIVFADGKPIPALKKLPPNSGLHFIGVPYDSGLQNSYYPARIDSADYPNLVTTGTSVDTIAFGTVLAAYDAPKGSPRYRKLAKFTQAFFRGFDGFLQAGRNPKMA